MAFKSNFVKSAFSNTTYNIIVRFFPFKNISLRILPIVSKLYHGHNLRAKSFNNFAKYLITTTHLHLAHSACGIQYRYE